MPDINPLYPTPLLTAVYTEDISAIDEILSKEENPPNFDAAGSTGLTASHMAACRNNVSILQKLHAKGGISKKHDDLGNTPLLWAIANSSIDAALKLIELDRDSINIANTHNDYSNTPLCLSIAKGSGHHDRKSPKCQSDIIQALLAAQAGVNHSDASGNSPLHYAVLHRNIDLIQQLLLHGADTKKTNKEGKAPLEMLQHDYTNSDTLLRKNVGYFTLDKSLFNEEVSRNITNLFQNGLSHLQTCYKIMDKVNSSFETILGPHINELKKQKRNKNLCAIQKIAAFDNIIESICKEISKSSYIAPDENKKKIYTNIEKSFTDAIKLNNFILKKYNSHLERFKIVALNFATIFLTIGIANCYRYFHQNKSFFFNVRSDSKKHLRAARNDLMLLKSDKDLSIG